jgi:hypothetical protein
VPFQPTEPIQVPSQRIRAVCLSTHQPDTRPSQQRDRHKQPDMTNQCLIDLVERTGPTTPHPEQTPRRNAAPIQGKGPHYLFVLPDQRNFDPASQVRGTDECKPSNRPKPIQRITVTYNHPNQSDQPRSTRSIGPTEASPTNQTDQSQPDQLKQLHVGTTTELMRDQLDHRTVPTIQ